MKRLFTRTILPTLMVVSLVLTSIWVAFGVQENFNVSMPTVSYEWDENGNYHVTYHEDGTQFRPMLSALAFLETLGQSGTSLVSFILDRGTYILDGYSTENITPPEYIEVDGITDLFTNLEKFFNWILEYAKVTLNLLLFVVSLPIYALTWIISSVFNVLGFLVTGKSFLDQEAMLEWLKNHPIGI